MNTHYRGFMRITCKSLISVQLIMSKIFIKTTLFFAENARRAHVIFTLFLFVCLSWRPTYIVLYFCFVFLRLMYPMLPVSLDCPFLIGPSVLSNVYFVNR
jgi:hypothetical protein